MVARRALLRAHGLLELVLIGLGLITIELFEGELRDHAVAVVLGAALRVPVARLARFVLKRCLHELLQVCSGVGVL